MANILIGVVTARIKDYCWPDFKSQLKWLEKKGFDVFIIDNSRIPTSRGFKSTWVAPSSTAQETTLKCMNGLREYFLKGSWTHLFILESDVFLDEEGLTRLLKMDGDVNNLTYPMRLERFNKYSLCVQSSDKHGSKMITPEDSQLLLNNGVIKLGEYKLNGRIVSHTGYGCTLVKRVVLEKLEFRLEKMADTIPFPDSFFHFDCLNVGFTDLLDTDYLPEHRNLKLETKNAIEKEQIISKLNRRQRRSLR